MRGWEGQVQRAAARKKKERKKRILKIIYRDIYIERDRYIYMSHNLKGIKTTKKAIPLGACKDGSLLLYTGRS